MTELLPLPSTGELLMRQALTPLEKRVGELTISSPDDYKQVVLTLQEVKHNLKKVDEFEEEEKRPLLDELAEIRERYKPLRDAFKQGESALKKLMTDYDAALEAQRLVAQRKANAEAEKERAKLAKQAERARAKGKDDAADALEMQAATVVAPVLQAAPPKVDGTHFTEHWCFEVINEAEVPPEYKVVGMRKLQKVVSALKAQCNIKGIRVWFEKRVASGSREPGAS